MPDLTRDRLNTARLTQTLVNAVCTCAQTHGRHAASCVTAQLTRSISRQRTLTAAVENLIRGVLADTEPFCCSCGEECDPANRCIVNGLTYHLGNCPRPHGTETTP